MIESMSADRNLAKPRLLPRPVPVPGPLRELKDTLYKLYLAADAPTLDQIHRRIHALADGDEASDPTATPKRDAIRDVISGDRLPQNVRHVTAVAAALVHPVGPVDGAVVRGHSVVEEIRQLWARAAAHRAPGRPITELTARELEVHRAIGEPPYVVRPHDHRLREVVAEVLESGASAVRVMVSESTSGKTRACHEVLHWSPAGKRSLAGAGWRIWPAVNPLGARQFLAELPQVGPHTVVWLNEAQRYLLEPPAEVREGIATGLRELLADQARGPVLVLGTLWPGYWTTLTRQPGRGEPDTFVSARRLLEGNRFSVPDVFTETDLAAARDSGAPELVEAAENAEGAAVVQYLAGVPDLVERYETATAFQSAIIHAAMDLRRLGHREWLPAALLREAAPAYLDARAQRLLGRDPDWFDRALAELTRLGRADSAVLHPDSSGYRLEDYFDQFGRRNRVFDFPTQPFWDAVAGHAAGAEDLVRLADNAASRLRLRIATGLYRAAGTPAAGEGLQKIAMGFETGGEFTIAVRLAHEAAGAGFPQALVRLADWRSSGRSGIRSGVEDLLRAAVDMGAPDAFDRLADLLERSGDHAGADEVARWAVEAGLWQATASLATSRSIDDPVTAERLIDDLPADLRTPALGHVALFRDSVKDQVEAERLARRAADDGRWEVFIDLAHGRMERRDFAGARRLLEHVAAAGEVRVHLDLADVLREQGDTAEAERVLRSAAESGAPDALRPLAWLLLALGDHAGAEKLAAEVDPEWWSDWFTVQASIIGQHKAGDHAGAEERLVQLAHAHPWTASSAIVLMEQLSGSERAEWMAGRVSHLLDPMYLARECENRGDRDGALRHARVAAELGDRESLVFLAGVHVEAGEWDEAERLGNDAASDEDPEALLHLGRELLRHGDRKRADAVVLRAVDTAVDESFSVYSGDQSWRVLAEVRGDDGLLITGLDAEGNTAGRWW
jgi:tetratricopeptide (TPR) repeat protein